MCSHITNIFCHLLKLFNHFKIQLHEENLGKNKRKLGKRKKLNAKTWKILSAQFKISRFLGGVVVSPVHMVHTQRSTTHAHIRRPYWNEEREQKRRGNKFQGQKYYDYSHVRWRSVIDLVFYGAYLVGFFPHARNLLKSPTFDGNEKLDIRITFGT